MPKIMLIDAAQLEETRVAVMDGKRLENFDIESASKKQLKGNIYLAKVTRVEPSLQAAFVNYGGNRHGFLPFAEIHPDYYRIPVEDRERLIAEQEELSRRMREEAAAREEREIAEAEARAQNPEAAEASEDMGEDLAEDSSDAEMGDAAPMGDESEDAVLEGANAEVLEDTGDGDGNAAEGEEQPEAEAAEEEGQEGQESQDSRRGRGRGRGRNRGRGRGRRGLDRRPDRIVEREGDEDESHGTPLWKRMHRSYKIQEVIKRGQIMLIQVVKEERGNKGAAVTSYITMPGRYCVLMPNSPSSGGVSRKVASHQDRKKMRDMLDELQVPDGMSVILRTAGVDRSTDEVRRDLDYLMRLWDKVRDTTMESTAPSLIHEEGSLVKRAIRDLYTKDIDDIIVEGGEGVGIAREVVNMMMPEHEDRVREYKDTVPLFIKYGAEPQIDAIHSNVVTLRSGGYLVINPTEALVSIDINSGRATRERHIEETALKTNLEAAEEIARQLRLRDLGGLVVIDFIDMESRRNNSLVEKRLRDALSSDRARVQVGRISSFGLLELSRQRLRPSLMETHFQTCPHCRGSGMLRTTEAMALAVMRAIETVGMEGRAGELQVTVPEGVALFLFNVKRGGLAMLEQRYGLSIAIKIAPVIEDDQGFHVDVTRSRRAERMDGIEATVDPDLSEDDMTENVTPQPLNEDDESEAQPAHNFSRHEESRTGGQNDRGRRRGRRGGRNRFRDRNFEGGHENRGDRGNYANPGNTMPVEGNSMGADISDVDDDIGNRKFDDQGNETDGNRMGSEQRIERGPRRERGGRGGRNRGGRGRDRGNRNGQQGGGDNRHHNRPRESRPDYDQVQPQPGNEQIPARSRPVHEDETPRVRDYERVNEVSGDKKKGWWKKLTG